jgi:hypothetical protein
MSSKSNNQGRAFEYITLKTLEQEIAQVRRVKVVENSSLNAALSAWETLSPEEQEIYHISARAGVVKIFELEPRILECSDDCLELGLQSDDKGKDGDVRDILIMRRGISWEVGLSLKHNHFAVKHSRLSATKDFGLSWYGVPCSEAYWQAVRPVFEYLESEGRQGTLFEALPDKDNDVYVPVLRAFIDEVLRQYEQHGELPKRLVEYLLGKYDFYKMISEDRLCYTQIQCFNLHGTLGQAPAAAARRSVTIPLLELPTRIVKLDFVPGKLTTAELYMDGGWQFTLRIHNAEKVAVPSLKFDVQIVGIPMAILRLDCRWS